MRRYYYTKDKNGLELTCNVCGKVEFLERIKDREVIGGKDTGEVYADVTPGWYFGKTTDMCPECNKACDDLAKIPN